MALFKAKQAMVTPSSIAPASQVEETKIESISSQKEAAHDEKENKPVEIRVSPWIPQEIPRCITRAPLPLDHSPATALDPLPNELLMTGEQLKNRIELLIE